MSAVTIEDLRRSGRPLIAACNRCGHRAHLAPSHLKLPLALPAVEARNRLVCTACGSTDLLTYPLSWRLMRHG